MKIILDKELSKEEIYQLIKADAKREKVIGLMQKYADQQAKKKAIAFGKFLSRCDPHTIANGEWFYTDIELKTHRLSTEQLYESEEFKKYCEQQNKEK